jgi:hypothetical protein
MFLPISRLHRAALLALPLALAAFAPSAGAQVAPRISMEQLEKMFSNMRTQTHWNIDGPMLWGYYFLDGDRVKLDVLSNALVGQGYRLVGLQKINGREAWRLHVEKVEVQSPQTLYRRDVELEALARKYAIASYDGMDVGPAAADAAPAAASPASR